MFSYFSTLIHHPFMALTTVSILALNYCLSHSSSGKKRKPAWTDRILWRLRPKSPAPDEQDENTLDMKKVKQLEEEEEYPLKIRQDLYTSNMEYSISDHKPVIGIFTMEVRDRALGNMFLMMNHTHPHTLQF